MSSKKTKPEFDLTDGPLVTSAEMDELLEPAPQLQRAPTADGRMLGMCPVCHMRHEHSSEVGGGRIHCAACHAEPLAGDWIK